MFTFCVLLLEKEVLWPSKEENNVFLNLIVPITKFSILIDSSHFHLSRNCRAITLVAILSPIATFFNWIPVIGHLRHSRDVNYVHFIGFFLGISFCFQNVWKIPLTFPLKRVFQRLPNLEICY